MTNKLQKFSPELSEWIILRYRISSAEECVCLLADLIERSRVSRTLKLLRSTQTRQSQRLDLALLRSGFVLGVGVWLMVWSVLSGSSIHTGHAAIVYFYPMSLFLLAYLAGRLQREVVGDESSGIVSLISLTGTRESEWTAARLIDVWISFLSVWLVRAPFLCLFFTLGGLKFEDLLAGEVLLLFLFQAATCRAMCVAQQADGRSKADWAGFGTIFLLEISLSIGRILVGLGRFLGWSFPIEVTNGVEWVGALSLNSRFISFASGGAFYPNVIGSLLLYLILSAYWIWRFQHRLYQKIGETPELALKGVKEKKPFRKTRTPLPRCWDDALAWQSYVYYAGGADNTTGRVILYGIAFVFVMLTIITGFFQSLAGLVALISFGIFVNVMNSPSHCIDQELKAKTLGSLVMTPHTGLDLYSGWRRGTFRLAIPDHVYALLVACVTAFVDPGISLVIVSLVLAIDSSGPLLMLSGLVPIAWNGLGTAFLVLIGLALIVTAGVFAASLIHPAMFPVAAIPLLWIFNQFLLRFHVEKWMKLKIDAEI